MPNVKFLRRVALLLAALPAAVAAQTPPAQLGARYVPAPWWMQEPVVASLGLVRAELAANRAGFGAQFQAIDRTAAEATEAAARKVRELDAALRAFGADKVRLETSFGARPLYEQYRDKEGRLIDNQRADRVERYEVSANLRLDVRDLSVLERAYAAVLAARPTSVSPVNFRLEPDNETKTWLYSEAVKDAARRARLAAAGAGAPLGAVKVIDPTGRVCETDVLAGWPSYADGGALPTDVEPPRAARMAPPPPPPPAPEAIQVTGSRVDRAPEPVQVTLQPPRQWLSAEACVVYSLR
jgi:uncharacterized protein